MSLARSGRTVRLKHQARDRIEYWSRLTVNHRVCDFVQRCRLVIVNREPTPLDEIAHAVIHGEAGPVLDAVASLVLSRTVRPDRARLIPSSTRRHSHSLYLP